MQTAEKGAGHTPLSLSSLSFPSLSRTLTHLAFSLYERTDEGEFGEIITLEPQRLSVLSDFMTFLQITNKVYSL